MDILLGISYKNSKGKFTRATLVTAKVDALPRVGDHIFFNNNRVQGKPIKELLVVDNVLHVFDLLRLESSDTEHKEDLEGEAYRNHVRVECSVSK